MTVLPFSTLKLFKGKSIIQMLCLLHEMPLFFLPAFKTFSSSLIGEDYNTCSCDFIQSTKGGVKWSSIYKYFLHRIWEVFSHWCQLPSPLPVNSSCTNDRLPWCSTSSWDYPSSSVSSLCSLRILPICLQVHSIFFLFSTFCYWDYLIIFNFLHALF